MIYQIQLSEIVICPDVFSLVVLWIILNLSIINRKLYGGGVNFYKSKTNGILFTNCDIEPVNRDPNIDKTTREILKDRLIWFR